MKFKAHQVEKPWGRTEIPGVFGNTGGRRIGEIWFEPAQTAELPLLTKYIFTSEKLSVQVHPNDEQARIRGLDRGKSECWYILDAEEGATLGLGLRASVPKSKLREAALDGSIEDLMDWKAVAPGDFYLVPAGTIHAIGAGISLLEFQQNSDVTYRLYDYGRPRELHLEDGLAVAQTEPSQPFGDQGSNSFDTLLVNGPHFGLFRATSDANVPPPLNNRRRWIMPTKGTAASGDDLAGTGESLLIEAGALLRISLESEVLIGFEGSI